MQHTAARDASGAPPPAAGAETPCEVVAGETSATEELAGLEASLRACEQAGDWSGVVRVLAALGRAHLQRGSPAVAMASLERGLRIALERHDLLAESAIECLRAELYARTGQWPEAAFSCARALVLTEQMVDARGRAQAMRVLAGIQLHQGQVSAAEETLDAALVHLDAFRDPDLHADLLRDRDRLRHLGGSGAAATQAWVQACGRARAHGAARAAERLAGRMTVACALLG